jgi:hypothetical protein
MLIKELRFKFVFRKIKQSRKQLIEIQDSVDPVSSTKHQLEEVHSFLIELEKEIKHEVPVKSSAKRLKYFTIFIASLLPLIKFLNTLMEELAETLGWLI